LRRWKEESQDFGRKVKISIFHRKCANKTNWQRVLGQELERKKQYADETTKTPTWYTQKEIDFLNR